MWEFFGCIKDSRTIPGISSLSFLFPTNHPPFLRSKQANTINKCFGWLFACLGCRRWVMGGEMKEREAINFITYRWRSSCEGLGAGVRQRSVEESEVGWAVAWVCSSWMREGVFSSMDMLRDLVKIYCFCFSFIWYNMLMCQFFIGGYKWHGLCHVLKEVSYSRNEILVKLFINLFLSFRRRVHDA